VPRDCEVYCSLFDDVSKEPAALSSGFTHIHSSRSAPLHCCWDISDSSPPIGHARVIILLVHNMSMKITRYDLLKLWVPCTASVTRVLRQVCVSVCECSLNSGRRNRSLLRLCCEELWKLMESLAPSTPLLEVFSNVHCRQSYLNRTSLWSNVMRSY
jgi:hypothetical protein